MNPQVYGAELSFWLSSSLAAREIYTTYPTFEDWGWYIEYFGVDGSEFAVHCYNVEGSREFWWLALRPFGRKLFGRDKPSVELARPLVAAIRTVLQEEQSVSEIEWLFPSKAV